MSRLQYDDFIFSKHKLWMWMFPNIKPLLAAHYQFKQKSCCWPLLFHVTRELDCGIREGFKCQQSIVLCIVVTSISVLWHGFGTRWQIICCQLLSLKLVLQKKLFAFLPNLDLSILTCYTYLADFWFAPQLVTTLKRKFGRFFDRLKVFNGLWLSEVSLGTPS